MSRKAQHWEGLTLDELRERWDRAGVHIYAQVASTNDVAKQLADEGAPPGTIVLAEMQTGGRGQSGRSWHSARGQGLYLSLVLRPRSLPNPGLVPILAGLGMARAVERGTPGVVARLKWPNDLIIEDKKAGGALSEATYKGGEAPVSLIVGIGINVHHRLEDFPAELRGVAISIDMAAGKKTSRLELADLVLEEVEERCVEPAERLGRDALRQLDHYDWLNDRRCSIVDAPRVPVQGRGAGIAPDGALLFRPDRGALQRVTRGRVVTQELPLPELGL